MESLAVSFDGGSCLKLQKTPNNIPVVILIQTGEVAKIYSEMSELRKKTKKYLHECDLLLSVRHCADFPFVCYLTQKFPAKSMINRYELSVLF